MRFVLEVDLDRLEGEAAPELGRILRYWAGAMKQLDLTEGAGAEIMDSAYHPVGRWTLTSEPARPGNYPES